MRVAAIDVDTKQIAWAVIDDGLAPTKWMTGSVKSKARRAEERFPGLLNSFRVSVHNAPGFWGQFVYLERPVYTRNAQATIDQGQMLGALRLLFLQENIHCSIVDNTIWKKGLLGNGHASKDDIRAWAVTVFGVAPESQDECDALAIAAWGLRTLRV